MASDQAAICVEQDTLIRSQRSNLLKYKEGQVVYDNSRQQIECLYLVVEGRVKLSRYSDGGRSTIIDVCHRNEFFGQSVFLPNQTCPEHAIAMEDTCLMSWTGPEIEHIVSSQPRVAILLVRSLAERIAGFSDRVESLCCDNIECRLARALLELALRNGIPLSCGAVRMPPLTHDFLAQYIGTSREMVTLHMNRFRREGCVSYSRRSLSLYRDILMGRLSDRATNKPLSKKLSLSKLKKTASRG